MMQEPAPFAAFEFLPGNDASGLLVLGDHAMRGLPARLGDLGLAPGEIDRHIAYDIGVEAMVRAYCRLSGSPALMARFSRLVIDANRGEDDPTLVMRLSDGAIIPGNARADAAERGRRIAELHRPYHEAIAGSIARMSAVGSLPALLSLHSFTPLWRGRQRPWQVAVLWDSDPRLAVPLIARLRSEGWTVGDNEPYDGALRGDTLYRHGTARGIAHVLVEVRQDLVADPADAAAWAGRLHAALGDLVADPENHVVRRFGSRTGPLP
jgi:predicted N-formylglutamate amidohydrolase